MRQARMHGGALTATATVEINIGLPSRYAWNDRGAGQPVR